MNSLRSLAVKLPRKQALIHLIELAPLEVLALPAAPTSFQRQCTNSGHNRFRGKGKGKSVVKGPFMRDMILLTGSDINSVPRQGKRMWLMENGHVISRFQLQRVVRVCG